jgi:2-methylcitrate dehydratase PrpD
MRFITDFRLENYILGEKWENLPAEVKERMRACFLDLFGALASGSRSEQFRVGLSLARDIFKDGDVAIIGTDEKLGFLGAATALGHSSNAYDIDDGHNITRAHHGTSFIGAILAAAYEKNITKNEFLTALLVAYEASVRSGAAIMDYYNFAHSSGTFGAVGVAVGVGRIYGFTREELNNVISIAEFNAPLVPGIRSVEYPSMNKDGVPFGVMTGILAVKESAAGFTGNKNLLEADEYRHYLDDLGEKYEVMSLYFKPYPCCRWAHPAIDALTVLMKENGIKAENVAAVTVKTFERATLLSKIEPKTADEAQYNIAYPVATAVIYGDFGIEHLSEDSLYDKKVLSMMKKLRFETDPKLDKEFPKRRICRVEIETLDGKKYLSPECEPRGEACENIGIDWLSDKFRRITAPVLTKEGQEIAISLIASEEDMPIRELVDKINDKAYWIN